MTIFMVCGYNVFMRPRPRSASAHLPLAIILTATSFFIIASLDGFFIQDDWYHLYQVFDKNPGEIAQTFSLWQPTVDPLHFYRPLSTKLFFFLMYRLFDLQHLAYLGVNALLFIVNSWLIYRVARFFVLVKTALWVLFFYSFSLAHFTLFAYHTKAEDLLFAAFTFLTLWLTLKKRPFLSGITFLLALMSRESALVIPIWIGGLLVFWPKRRSPQVERSFSLTIGATLLYLGLRTVIYGWPQDKTVYVVQLGPHIIGNLFKYAQWNLNLVGLLGESTLLGWAARLGTLVFLSVSVWSLAQAFRTAGNRRVLAWGGFWWLLFLGPVLFFREHRDPWNLAVAAGGLSVLLATLSTGKRLLGAVAAGTYFGLFLVGLIYYHSRHWVMTRADLVRKTQTLVASQCHQEEIIFPQNLTIPSQELQYAWYYDSGPKVFCNNRQLIVRYPDGQ